MPARVSHRSLLAPLLLGVAVMGVWGAGCTSEPPPPAAPVVATVGETAILADDFARSYALGFPALKRGDDPRRAYLDRMIGERLMALEAARLGLDAAPDVQARIEDLRAELLVEQVFERNVNAHVAVTEAEVDSALQREQVRFKLRYVPAPTMADALLLRRLFAADGFDAAVQRVIAQQPEQALDAADFVTPYLTAADVPPDVLNVLAALPVGEVSSPIALGGQFLIVEVMDVRRDAVPLADAEARTRVREMLWQQKARRQARAYVRAQMMPHDLVVRGRVLGRLSEALWPHAETLDAQALTLLSAVVTDEAARADVAALMDETLATTRDSSLSVRAFLAAYPLSRYRLTATTERAFRGALFDGIGVVLRDAAFVQQARAAGLDAVPAVTRDLDRWTDKWRYHALMRQLRDTTRVAPEDARTYFERHRAHYAPDGATRFEDVAARVEADAREALLRARLPDYLATLRARYPVVYHADALAAVPLEDSSTALPALLFKAHTGRLAYPVVDPVW